MRDVTRAETGNEVRGSLSLETQTCSPHRLMRKCAAPVADKRHELSSREWAWPLAVGETVILRHPPLPLAGVSIWVERGC